VQDSVSVWEDEFDKLPKAKEPAMNAFAAYVDQRVTGKLGLSPMITGSQSFTFALPAFVSPLLPLVPTIDPVSGKTALANAWQASALASVMFVGPGAYVGAPTPATTFSLPPAVIVNPASVVAAYASLLSGLLATKPSEKSEIPKLLHDAFASLSYVVTGINSLPIPTPLVVTASVS
jgi:hypothetical protein